jgi:prepilin-type N-terminal cleavage/methylation domain-containing protein
MLYKEKAGFTLFELLVVVIIVGILAALGLPQFTKTKEHALGREAVANLKLIAAAQRLYAMETGSYYPMPTGTDSNITTINSNLRLSIPNPSASSSRNWNYAVTDTSAPSFSVIATRTSGTICSYSIDSTTEEPTTTTCP